MNIKTTRLKIIADQILKEDNNIKTNGFLHFNEIWYVNFYKNGNITWSFAYDTKAYKSYYIPQLIESCECRLEKQFIKTVKEGILLRLKPLKKTILNLDKKERS